MSCELFLKPDLAKPNAPSYRCLSIILQLFANGNFQVWIKGRDYWKCSSALPSCFLSAARLRYYRLLLCNSCWETAEMKAIIFFPSFMLDLHHSMDFYIFIFSFSPKFSPSSYIEKQKPVSQVQFRPQTPSCQHHL